MLVFFCLFIENLNLVTGWQSGKKSGRKGYIFRGSCKNNYTRDLNRFHFWSTDTVRWYFVLQEVDFNWNTLNLAIWACNIKSVDYWLELELCIKRVISGQTDISHKIFNSSARLMQFFFYFLHDFCKYMYLVNVKRFYKREEGEGVNFFMVGVGLFLIMLIFECCTVIQYFPVFLLWKLCSDISQLY